MDIPTLNEVTEFFSKRGYASTNARQFYKFYQDKGWTTYRGAPLVDWRRAAARWIETLQKQNAGKKTRSADANLESARHIVMEGCRTITIPLAPGMKVIFVHNNE